MMNFTTFQSSRVRYCLYLSLGLFTFLLCPLSEAAREALVVAPKALIYSNAQLQAPLGYVARGKKVMVGEKPLARGQVYAVVMTNHIAYIKAQDISFELDEKDNFVATRFYELTKETYNTHYSLGFINYTSQYKSVVTGLDEAFNWYGYQLKGDALFDNGWGVHVFTTGMWATKGEEQFRTIELGFGGSYMVLEMNRLRLNLFGQVVAIPFANYALGSKFRVNGGGYGGGVGLSVTYDVRKRWGFEGSFGIYQTRLMGFDAPEEFESPDPTFSGARTVLSAYYRF